jgi:ubiquinone/menaquinone biosynthesis C-methylase UbiE
MAVTRQDYSNLAESYDDTRFGGEKGHFLYKLDASIVKKLITIAHSKTRLPNFIVLDLPVGTGRALEYMQTIPDKIVGCDLTPNMLQIAQKRSNRLCIGLLQGDASTLPFRDAAFDCVVTLRFFHLFKQGPRQIFVQEFNRILKPGGFILCSFTNGWYGFGLNYFRKMAGQFDVHFQSSREINRLFPKWQVHALYGNYLPRQSSIKKVAPRIEAVICQLTKMIPLNRFCFERFYLLQKPSE